MPLVPGRIRRGLPVYLVSALLAVGLFGVRVHGHAKASRVDRWIDGRLSVQAQPWRDLVEFVVRFGSLRLAPFIAVGLAVLCWRRGARRAAALCLLAPGLTDVLTEAVLKPAVGRTKLGAFAYPSGHAGRAVALATVVLLLARDGGPLDRGWAGAARRATRAAAAGLGAGVAFSVIALGWHYATDVAGAVLLATAATLGVALVLDVATGRARTPTTGS